MRGEETAPPPTSQRHHDCVAIVFPGTLTMRPGSGVSYLALISLAASLLWNVGSPCWGAYWGSKWPVSSNPNDSNLPFSPLSNLNSISAASDSLSANVLTLLGWHAVLSLPLPHSFPLYVRGCLSDKMVAERNGK